MDPQTGEVYVSTFDRGGNNRLLHVGDNGRVLAEIDLAGAPRGLSR